MSVEAKLAELGLTLPEPLAPVAAYVGLSRRRAVGMLRSAQHDRIACGTVMLSAAKHPGGAARSRPMLDSCGVTALGC